MFEKAKARASAAFFRNDFSGVLKNVIYCFYLFFKPLK